MKTLLIAAAVTFALAIPASAQMANETAKTGTAMQAESGKPMAGSMAMSADAGMKKPMKKMKKGAMMGDKPMTEDQMKPDSMKH